MIKSQGPSCTDAENLVIIGLFPMWAVSLCVSICFGSGTKKVFWIASLSASLHVIWRVSAENRVKLVSWFSQLVFASRFPAGSVFTEMKNEPGPLLCCHLQWNTWGETEVSPLTARECFDRDSMLRLTSLSVLMFLKSARQKRNHDERCSGKQLVLDRYPGIPSSLMHYINLSVEEKNDTRTHRTSAYRKQCQRQRQSQRQVFYGKK